MAEPTLKRGSKGQPVKDLQEALTTLGFVPGPVDGIFGAATEAAVMALQTDRGIDADGIVGPTTWLNIDEADRSEPLLQQGARGLPVRRLQKRLTLAGFDVGEVDGRFGAATERGVRALQASLHLIVDGIVGPGTWAVVAALESEGPVG